MIKVISGRKVITIDVLIEAIYNQGYDFKRTPLIYIRKANGDVIEVTKDDKIIFSTRPYLATP